MAKQSRLAVLSDSELQSMTTKEVAIRFYNGNVGAAWNALYGPGGRLNGQTKAQPVKAVQTQHKPNELPGRVIDFMLDSVCLDESIEIKQHHIELVVLSDTPAWNRLVRRFGQEERAMLVAFLGNEPTMADRAEQTRQEAHKAPFKASAFRMEMLAKKDAKLAEQAGRFESSRYDAVITDFYCAE